ncbi:BglG family transcription antiterminator [Niallia circulans]|uniref:BglG family transcription antiterminator n=1 Tax=Niallia circulans TaxID=1397 RepID=UPI0015616FEA|nr:PRD domain-containing protein [Niallia circulans]NRG33072.1 PRD domain-containing protein [Niallia circulans]
MRVKILIEILQKNDKVLSKNFLAEKMNLSDSSIRNLIREANSIGLKNGFQVELIRGEGYYLLVLDNKKFKRYMSNSENNEYDVYNAKQRLKILLFTIFQMEGYFTFEQLAEKIKISRTTIVRDFKKVEKILNQHGLFLEKKAHYGLKITGTEQNYRKAFSEIVLASDLFLEPAQEFYKFLRSLNHNELRSLLSKTLIDKGLKMSDVAFDNILNHIKILIFRVRNKNFISNQINVERYDKVYNEIATCITTWIEKQYDIRLPKSEGFLLSAHIAGKATAGSLGVTDRKELWEKIESILHQIDLEFSTELISDKELKEAILLHMFPLLNRMYNNLQLNNPIIDEIYRKYSNVFLIAFRFGELIEENYSLKLTIDEIGYLALHFAAHMERLKLKTLDKFKRIVVICSTGGGSAHLLKLKLESIFPKAIIVTSSANEIHRFKDELPDLFLATVPINESFGNIPVIHIKHWLDDDEINRIKETVPMSIEYKDGSYKGLNLLDLFSEKFFYKNITEDYLNLLFKLSNDLIHYGFAPKNYDQSVIERENKFTTIYKNGVAGPHALSLNAIKNTVSVAVYDKPIEWKGRSVQIVFLINLKKGHLFLHKEISRLLLHIMEDKYGLERLTSAKNFIQFKKELKRLVEK